jgi:hypothetical protein
MSSIAVPLLPLTGQAAPSGLAPSPASANAWLREMERATGQARQPLDNGGTKDRPLAQDSASGHGPRDAGARLPEPGSSQAEASLTGSAARDAGDGRRAGTVNGAGGAAVPEAGGTPEEGASGPAPITDTLEPDEKVPFESAYAQLLARQAWSRRKVTVANLEDGLAVSIRDPDIEDAGGLEIAGLLGQECLRGGYRLVDLTINGHSFKDCLDVKIVKIAGQQERE